MIPQVLHGVLTDGVVKIIGTTAGSVPATAQPKEGYALEPGNPPSLYVVVQ